MVRPRPTHPASRSTSRSPRGSWPAILLAIVSAPVLSGACAPPVPTSCEAWCRAALSRTEACLVEDGLTWEATTWGSAEGWLEACETWAWTSVRLEADARRRGEVDGRGHTEGVCASWLGAAEADALDCATLDTIDWDTVPGTDR